MLIDVHGHFYSERSAHPDWQRLNTRRLEAGARIGISAVVASVLGTWGRRSPTYFPAPDDVTHANEYMLGLQRRWRGRVFGYCVVNPNYPAHAVQELARCLDAGMIGIKLAASRRADDAHLDPIAAVAGERGVPILHHVWQRRRREWPGQEASDAVELSRLAERHPGARFILAHLGGGGDWSHTVRAVRRQPNVWVDLSGSGIDPDMVERALDELGSERLLWGTDLTIDTGWAKLRYLESLALPPSAMDAIRGGNAATVFPPGAFDVA